MHRRQIKHLPFVGTRYTPYKEARNNTVVPFMFTSKKVRGLALCFHVHLSLRFPLYRLYRGYQTLMFAPFKFAVTAAAAKINGTRTLMGLQ